MSEHVYVGKGPGIRKPEYRSDFEPDAGFRIVTYYDVSTDSLLTRFDVLVNSIWHQNIHNKRGGDQLTAALYSARPAQKPQNGDLQTCELEIPHGVASAYGFTANAKDLIAALRGLADQVEQVLR